MATWRTCPFLGADFWVGNWDSLLEIGPEEAEIIGWKGREGLRMGGDWKEEYIIFFGSGDIHFQGPLWADKII